MRVDPPGSDGVMDIAGRSVRVASAGRQEELRSSGRAVRFPEFVFYFVEDSQASREAVLAICDDVRAFLTLPMFIAYATEEQASRVADVPNVVVGRVGRSLASLVPLVRGLDVMAAVEKISAVGADAEYVVGGTRAGIGEYPVLVEREGRLLFGSDPGLQFDTRPARLAVVNLSLGPPVPDWPFAELDPVNVATRLVSQSQLCVFAIGNQDDERPGREMTSPWAEAPWVLGVGASEDAEGTKLAEYSVIGLPDIPASGPDVISWGTSRLDEAETGTSYAAPRVSEAAALCASATDQLRHVLVTARGETTGVPLVGYGWIDRDYRGSERFPPRVPVPAQPPVGIDREGAARGFAACEEVGIALDVSIQPERLRRMVTSAARPVPNARPHEVGAGFIDLDVLIDWLDTWTTKHLAWFFAAEAPSSRSLELLPDAPVFAGRAELTKLASVLGTSAPLWRWDFASGSFTMKPEGPLPS